LGFYYLMCKYYLENGWRYISDIDKLTISTCRAFKPCTNGKFVIVKI